MRYRRPIAVALLAGASPALADIIPTQGTQSMSGSVTVTVLGTQTGHQSYALSAPNTLASWTPANQDIEATGGAADVHVQTSYSSTIDANNLILSTTASVSTTGASTAADGDFNSTQTFTLHFTIDRPGHYVLSAQEYRFNHTGWSASPPQITFGLENQPPMVSLQLNPPPFAQPFTATFGPTDVTLAPDTYVIQASDALAWSGPHGYILESSLDFSLTSTCYANCDGSTTPPILNVSDFSCFLNRFAAGDSYANCDGSTTPPVLTVLDFSCFLNAFAAGCP